MVIKKNIITYMRSKFLEVPGITPKLQSCRIKEISFIF